MFCDFNYNCFFAFFHVKKYVRYFKNGDRKFDMNLEQIVIKGNYHSLSILISFDNISINSINK